MTTLDIVQSVYAQVLGRPCADVDKDVYSLGGDSMQTLQIAVELELRFAIELPSDQFEEHSDARAVAAWIDRRLAAAAEGPAA